MNEALRLLDGLVQLSVRGTARTEPPESSTDGDRFLVAPNATGAWTGWEGSIAVASDGLWTRLTPKPGWRVWVEEFDGSANGPGDHLPGERVLLVFDGSIWADVIPTEFQNLGTLGVNASADTTNRLTVASDAVLLTHAGSGMQMKLNKNAPGDTASLLYQSGWSARAEIGLAGDDDLRVKVSPDGGTFVDAMVVDRATGIVRFPAGASGVAATEFGAGPVVNTGYMIARGADLVTNGTGLLGNNYNMPEAFVWDGAIAPDLPAAFRFSGHYAAPQFSGELLPVDPNRVYRLRSCIRQASRQVDWSGHTRGDRHLHYMGLSLLDADLKVIIAADHMVHNASGTTLAAPLSPGDTTLTLVDASRWQNAPSAAHLRSLIIFEYRNSFGYRYDHYSKLRASDLWDPGAINANTVTLKAPFPGHLANPDHPDGTWPAGTRVANGSNGGTYKYSFYNALLPPETDRWFATESFMGGIDRSGNNLARSFAPGTAYARLLWLPNYSNRPGGWSIYPDTGDEHNVWYAGISVVPEPMAIVNGGDFSLPRADAAGTALEWVTNPGLCVTAL